jgi:multimeric flavodoxin WrbA
MKVIAFNGSARKDGNTALLISHVFEELQKENIHTEMIQLAEQKIHGCRACYKCFNLKNKKCFFDDDIINTCIAKMEESDGIILASPTYFGDISSEIKALIDRAGFVARANNNMLARKIGAGIITMRRAGALHAFDSLNHFFLIQSMIIPGSVYWNIGIGREKGEVAKDQEGINTMHILGENMAWLLKKTGK